MGEQHDLAEAELLQLVQAIDDRRGSADQSALRAARKPVCRIASRRTARTLGSELSSGASAITASTESTIVSGSRPMSSQIVRSTAVLRSSSPSAYVGTFHTSA